MEVSPLRASPTGWAAVYLQAEALCPRSAVTIRLAPNGRSARRPLPAERADSASRSGRATSAIYLFLPWQFLNFLPLPHGQGSLRPTPT